MLCVCNYTDQYRQDTIDVSNLNRQFLFRQSDVGQPKATVAAAFVMNRVKGVHITPYVGKIQDKDEDYYSQFQMVICGLDSIEARRWINAMLVDLANGGGEEGLKPLIDGGTEGFKGQAKVILPTMTSCIECQLDLHAPRQAVPLCTLATIPRQPAHCIEWARIVAWEEQRKDDTLDTDDPEHIAWLFEKADTRAKEFGIQGVTYSLTQGVVKNIIPAIASTNAIIAAACTNEALKLATSMNPFLGNLESNNYMQYGGDEGIYTYTFQHMKKDDCPVCGVRPKELTVSPKMKLGELIESFAERPEAQLKNPSVRSDAKTLYVTSPASLEAQTRPNLEKRLEELLTSGEEIGVTDPAFQTSFKFKINFA